eukprot:364516-Chlamydomonas_euryale.AAC.14
MGTWVLLAWRRGHWHGTGGAGMALAWRYGDLGGAGIAKRGHRHGTGGDGMALAWHNGDWGGAGMAKRALARHWWCWYGAGLSCSHACELSVV